MRLVRFLNRLLNRLFFNLSHDSYAYLLHDAKCLIADRYFSVFVTLKRDRQITPLYSFSLSYSACFN